MKDSIVFVTGEGYQGGGSSIETYFAPFNQRFVQTAFDVESRDVLSSSFRSPVVARLFNPLQGADESVANAGATAVMDHECRMAGLQPIHASLRDFFVQPESDLRSLAIADRWESTLDDVDIVGLSTSYILSLPYLARAVELLKDLGKTVVVGGPLLDKLGPRRFGPVMADYFMTAEVETQLPILLRELHTDRPRREVLDSIPSLFWHERSTLVQSKAPYQTVGFEDWSFNLPAAYIAERKGILNYEGVRGCPFRCEFCDYPSLLGNKKARFKPAEQIFADWTRLADAGVKSLNVLDSLFTVPRKRLLELTGMLIKSGLNTRISWRCFARATELSEPEVPALMREAGCTAIMVGIESGAQEILNNMNKKTTVEENIGAIRNCNAAGVWVCSTLVVGFPGETSETFSETKAMLRDASAPSVHAFAWFPAPGEGKVPILLPDRVAKYRIQVTYDPTIAETRFWGRDLSYVFPATWQHQTMSSGEALQLVSELADDMYFGRIDSHDQIYSPVGVMMGHSTEIADALGYTVARKLTHGMKHVYREFLAGAEPTAVRAATQGLLQACGVDLTRRDGETSSPRQQPAPAPHSVVP